MTALRTTGLVNPHKDDALVLDGVVEGMKILYWRPGEPGSVRRVTIVDGKAYQDVDGDMVIDVIGQDGKLHTELTSTLGLTPNRYPDRSGRTMWHTIAIVNEEE